MTSEMNNEITPKASWENIINSNMLLFIKANNLILKMYTESFIL